MGRGSAVIDSKALLYGAIPPRPKTDLSKTRTLRNRAIEHYNQLGLLYKITVPEGSRYKNPWLVARAPMSIYLNSDGQLHRVGGAAAESDSGIKEYWVNGLRHREDGPAIDWPGSRKEYWVNNQRHRTNGPAIEWDDGSKEYLIRGQRHRENGPAIEISGGDIEYWIKGQIHREDGPAVVHANGDCEYWLEDKQVFKSTLEAKG